MKMQTTTQYLNQIIATCIIFCLMLPSSMCCCTGCVLLDEQNFQRTIERFPFTIVKFDQAYPFGLVHEEYGAFSKMANQVTKDLLVAIVGIKDYGERENEKLALNFGIKYTDVPRIILFNGGRTDDYIVYPKEQEVTKGKLEAFVRKHTKLYFPREGCLRELSDATVNFAKASDEEQLKMMQKVEDIVARIWYADEKAKAQIYLDHMRLIRERGYEYVVKETERLERLLKGKVLKEKMVVLRRKLNVLKTFLVHDHDEL